MGAIDEAINGLFVPSRPKSTSSAGISRLLARSPTSVAGRSAVVVGGRGGIGRAIVDALASSGVRVLCADLALVSGESTHEAASGFVPVDVTVDESVRALSERSQELLGRIDLVVNAAGVIDVRSILDTPAQAWAHVLDINLVGAFRIAQAFSSLMVSQPASDGRQGLVIHLGSLAAFFGRPLVSSYGASKAGLNSLCKSFSVALAEEGVSSCVVFPGNVREGMWGHLGRDFAAAEGRAVAEVESERTYQPGADIGEIVADVLASPGMTLSGHGITFLRGVEAL